MCMAAWCGSWTGVLVGRKRVARLMRGAGIQGLCRRRRRRKGARALHPAGDLLRREFTAPTPNRIWVADIERHEALLNLAVVKGHRHRLVAAGRLKLRAA